jgi:hypothetical protein
VAKREFFYFTFAFTVLTTVSTFSRELPSGFPQFRVPAADSGGASEGESDIDLIEDPVLGKDDHAMKEIRSRFDVDLQRRDNLETCVGSKMDLLKIKDLAARRFINRPDWEAYLADTSHAKIDPSEVYSPAPVTWNDWWDVAENEVRAAAIAREPLSIELLEKWNRQSLDGTGIQGGAIKETPNYGSNRDRADAQTRQQIQTVNKFKIDAQQVLSWVGLVCHEDLPKDLKLPTDLPDCQQIAETVKNLPDDPFWKQTGVDMAAGNIEAWYWYACWPRANPKLKGDERACGMIVYPVPSMARKVLSELVRQVNQYFSADGKKRHEDPIQFALRIQRTTVALHPFPKGNGRLSRWIMDYITERAAIPPILVQNMNDDISTPLKLYQKQGRQGVNESLLIMEDCLANYETACQSAPDNIQPALKTLRDSRCGLLK